MTITNPSRRTVLTGTATLAACSFGGTVPKANATQARDQKLIDLLADHEAQEAKFLTALRKLSQVEFTNHPRESGLEIIKDHELAELLLIERRLAATPANNPTGIAIKLALWKKYSLSIEPTIDEVDTTTALVLSALADAEKQMDNY